MGGSNLIQSPDVDERLRRAFGIANTQVAPVIAPEIVPVVIVADLANTAPPGGSPTVREFYARGLAVGANTAYIQFFNPADSGHYIRFLDWWIRSSVADTIDLIKLDAEFDPSPTGGISFFEDLGLTGLPVITVATGTTVAPASTANTLFAVDVGASAGNFATVQYHTQMFVPPGKGRLVQRVALAGVIEVGCRARQRSINQ
jgi:hypothetical protein